MKKTEITQTLLQFYEMLGKHKVKLGLTDPRRYVLTWENFIIIGGSSLVLQDKLDETSDIDLVTDSKETFYCSIKTVDEEGIPRTIGTTNGLYRDILKFSFNRNTVNIFKKDTARFSCDPSTKTQLNLDSLNVYVRPINLIKKDYEMALTGLESTPELFRDDRRIEEYTKRITSL